MWDQRESERNGEGLSTIFLKMYRHKLRLKKLMDETHSLKKACLRLFVVFWITARSEMKE